MTDTQSAAKRALERPVNPEDGCDKGNSRLWTRVSLRRLWSVSDVRWNIGGNFLAAGWSALLTVATVPLYVHFLGIEQYGLIGFFAALQGILMLLDAGLSTTLNRYLSGLSVSAGGIAEMGDTLRTLEIPYWGGSLVICLITVLIFPFAHIWFGTSHLSSSTLNVAVLMMGLATAVQFPFALYQGGLQGLQRQVLLSLITIGFVTARAAGALIVVAVEPTIQAYLAWQIALNLTQSIATGVILWLVMPASIRHAKFSAHLLRRMWRFAGSISIISVESLVLTLGPRIIMSKMLPLRQFGFFSVAVVVSSSLYYMVTPVFSAVFPRFTQLVEMQKDAELADVYHRSCQLISLLVLPAALVLTIFSPSVLLAWTGSQSVVRSSQWFTILLVAGTAMQALCFMAYALQLANNWTKLPIYENLWSIIVLLPLTIGTASKLGGVGAALAWTAVNAGWVFIGIPIMHRRLLKGQLFRFYALDVGPALVSAGAVTVLLRFILPLPSTRLPALTEVLVAAAAALIVAALSLPEGRRLAMRAVNRIAT